MNYQLLLALELAKAGYAEHPQRYGMSSTSTVCSVSGMPPRDHPLQHSTPWTCSLGWLYALGLFTDVLLLETVVRPWVIGLKCIVSRAMRAKAPVNGWPTVAIGQRLEVSG